MLKKIVTGALLTGLVAVLIWGAVIRTNAVNGRAPLRPDAAAR